MRFYICAGVAGLMLFAGSSIAFAQDVVISPDQEVVIKEYVTKQKVLPIQVPPDVRITVGSTLPDTVVLNELDVTDVNCRYVVVDGQTILGEPTTRKIIRTIK